MKKLLFILLILIAITGCTEEEVQRKENTEEEVAQVDKEEVQVEQEEAEEEVESTILLPEGEILFSSERGGDRDLYLINVQTREERVLLDLPSKEGHGDFAPDGERIVFFSDMDGDRDLYTIDMRDKDLNIVQLTDSKGSDHLPDWSPDGKYIAFESTRDGNSEIYLMDSDGTNQRRITNNNVRDKQPKFTRDGKFIGFTTIVNGVQKYAKVSVKDVLSSMEDIEVSIYDNENIGYIDYSSDGKKIAYHGKESGTPEVYISDLELKDIKKISTPDNYTNWVPVFSPDNKWIAFNKEMGFGTGNIYIMKTDSSDVIQLTDTSTADWGPDWRPYRNNIVFFDSNRDGDRELYRYDTLTGKRTQLTDNSENDGLPYVSPCRNKILFFSDVDGDDELYVLDLLGGDTTKLTDNEFKDRSAVWAPNDDFIVFCSDRDGDLDLYIMNTDGSNVKKLTYNDSKDFWPAVSPDSKKILYTVFSDTQDTYMINLEDWRNKEKFTNELVLKNCSRAEYSHKQDKIAFSTKKDGHWQIAIADLENLAVKQLTSNNRNEWVPTWVDEETIVFSREHGYYKASIIKLNIVSLEEKVLQEPNAQNWRPIVQ